MNEALLVPHLKPCVLTYSPLNVSHLSGCATGWQIKENKAQNMSLLAAERPVSGAQ